LPGIAAQELGALELQGADLGGGAAPGGFEFGDQGIGVGRGRLGVAARQGPAFLETREAVQARKPLIQPSESQRRSGRAAPAAAAPAEASSAGLEDPGPALLAAAAEVLQGDLARAAAEFKDRCSQYLVALSDKKWQGAEISSEGKGALLAPGGQRTPIAELPPRDADLYYLSLRLAVVEKLGQRVKVPLVIEDCFAEAVDAPRLPLINRMLKHLGSVTQVLHVSGSGQNAFQADALVSV
jgi:hypothetical protein